MKSITLLSPDRTIEKKIVFNRKQKKFLEAIFSDRSVNIKNSYKEFAFFGGVRSGKSFACQLAVFLICVAYPKVNALYIRDTYDQLKDSVIKQFNDDFDFCGLFEYHRSSRTIFFENGSVLKFRAFDVDGSGILSTEYDLIAICQAEDIQYDLFLLALSRLSGKNLPNAILLTEGNPANTWVKLRYKDKPIEVLKSERIFFIETSTEDNVRNLPEGYIDFLKKNYPESWINRYLLGGWDQIDEMVFSEFRESVHVIDPFRINFDFEKVVGFDYGYRNPSAFVWIAVNRDDEFFIFDEFYEREKTVPELVKEYNRHGRIVCVADYAIKSPGRDGKSIWSEMLMSGVALYESNKDELHNIQLVNRLLKTRRLFIFRNCYNLLAEIKKYKWQRLKIGTEKNLSEKPIDKDNHAIDAMLYAIAFVFGKRNKNEIETKTIKDLTEEFIRIEE